MWSVLGLTLIQVVSSTRTAQLRGNIIFETERPQPVTINPNYVQFNRQFDLTQIELALDLLDNHTQTYDGYCKQIIQNTGRPEEYFRIMGNIGKASEECKAQNGYLPEIRNQKQANTLITLMKVMQIDQTPAGIFFQNGTARYLSNGMQNQYVQLSPCLTCSNTKQEQHKIDNIHRVAYDLNDENQLQITRSQDCLYTAHQSCNKTILCLRGENMNNNLIKTLLSISCKRDTTFIAETNKYLRQEYNNFINPEPTNRAKRDSEKGRSKRQLPLLPVKTGGVGGFISNAISILNPFKIVGEIVGGFFGLATAREMKMTHEAINKMSYQLFAIRINQIELVEATNALLEHAKHVDQMFRIQAHDMAVMYGELDNKIALRYLQSIIQATLLKMHSALLSARQYKPSPYVFGANEMRFIATNSLFSKHTFSTDIEEVAMTLTIVESKFTFIIAVPIKDERTKFHLFKVKRLPIFHDGKTYNIKIANKYYGLNIQTNEYIILSETDYQNCLEKPICSLPNPIYTISSSSPCDIRSYLTGKQLCQPEKAQPAGPSFLNYENTTYFSVPEPVEIQIRCYQNGGMTSRHERIEGIGSFQTHTGCITQVTESAQIRPLHIAEIHNLETNSAFDMLKQFDFSAITYPPEPNLTDTTTIKPPTIMDAKSFSEGMSLLLNFETTSTQVARTFLIIFIILTIFFTIYGCSTTFRLWFNNCMSCTKPSKYWSKYYDNVPQFIRVKPSTNQHIHEKIQSILSAIRKPFQTEKIMHPTTQTKHDNNFDEDNTIV